VMPSLWEGLPLALILAMGAGLPVVATAVAGVPELVTDAETGWLVPPADPTALARALAAVLADREHAKSVGAAAKQWVRPRFGVDEYVAAVAALYDRLLMARAA